MFAVKNRDRQALQLIEEEPEVRRGPCCRLLDQRATQERVVAQDKIQAAGSLCTPR